MAVALDTSALLALAIEGRQRAVVFEALITGEIWFASALALTEAIPAIDRLTEEEMMRSTMEDSVRRVWDHLYVVPIDQRCLDRAMALCRSQPVRVADAIHLASAERLPGPVKFVTFDPAQIGVALGLGFEVVST